jgi:8-oxo-dGTP pyrophosphatase MutT (NUDIX family)
VLASPIFAGGAAVVPWRNGDEPMSRLSAGLLPYRHGRGGDLEVLLVHPGGPLWKGKEDHAWSLPKGEYHEGQDALTEAEREFAEEIGARAPEGPRIDLGSVRQAAESRYTLGLSRQRHGALPMSQATNSRWNGHPDRGACSHFRR